METPEPWNITLPMERPDGRKIHVYDYREGYDLAEDLEPIACPHCGKPVAEEFHYGVYVSRVQYMSFDSRLCAYEYQFEDGD